MWSKIWYNTFSWMLLNYISFYIQWHINVMREKLISSGCRVWLMHTLMCGYRRLVSAACRARGTCSLRCQQEAVRPQTDVTEATTCHISVTYRYNFDILVLTDARALGKAHLPPTKVFRRLSEWAILQIFAQLISPKPLIKSIILLFISSLWRGMYQSRYWK